MENYTCSYCGLPMTDNIEQFNSMSYVWKETDWKVHCYCKSIAHKLGQPKDCDFDKFIMTSDPFDTEKRKAFGAKLHEFGVTEFRKMIRDYYETIIPDGDEYSDLFEEQLRVVKNSLL